LSRKPSRASLVVRNGNRRSIDGRHIIGLAAPDNVEILLHTERRLESRRDQWIVMSDEHANSVVDQHGGTPPSIGAICSSTEPHDRDRVCIDPPDG
jgi:hypothetical protein